MHLVGVEGVLQSLALALRFRPQSMEGVVFGKDIGERVEITDLGEGLDALRVQLAEVAEERLAFRVARELVIQLGAEPTNYPQLKC